ncbi:ABC transporter permease [Asticcacaulis taihuensis]|uniref:ABC transporter permease n=1 Tax=Asticcacaulis taihuensis TaxID=260084 RepID=UPI0026F0A969|nr:ABC transporter permease [Asticcacaulis taihuensis]
MKNIKTLLIGLIVPVLLLLLWDVQARQGGANSLTFVRLDQIGAALIELYRSGDLGAAYGASLIHAGGGLLWGGLIGLLVGAAMGLVRPVEWALVPLYNSFRQVPLLGWLPLIGLWFGSGESAKIIIVAISAFYPTVLYTYEGLKNVENRFTEVGSIYRLNAWQTFWRIQWPAALPSIFTGLFQALAFTWISTIGVELLFAAGNGLGTIMQTGQLNARLDIVLVCILFVGLTGFTLNLLVSALSRHVLRWRPVKN